MAVTVVSITPADGTLAVSGSSPVVVEINDSVTDLDHDLVEIIVNGVSNTTANNGLDYWGLQTISGGAYVSDLQTVTYATLRHWCVGGIDGTATVVVKYNTVTLSTTTFDFAFPGRYANQPQMAYAAESPVYLGPGTVLQYIVESPSGFRLGGTIRYNVRRVNTTKSDIIYTVGYIIRTEQPAAMLVGQSVETVQAASAITYGFNTAKQPSAVIVQGWMWAQQPTAFITGIVFRYGQSVSSIVGVEIMAKVPASAVVYKVIRETVLDIEIQDASTKTLLEALGVTFT